MVRYRNNKQNTINIYDVIIQGINLQKYFLVVQKNWQKKTVEVTVLVDFSILLMLELKITDTGQKSLRDEAVAIEKNSIFEHVICEICN